MNDIRRTILWVIFGFSLVLLWDQWQVYNGRKADLPALGARVPGRGQGAAGGPDGRRHRRSRGRFR